MSGRKQRSGARNLGEYLLARAVLAFLALIPLPLAFPLARAIMRMVDRLAPRLRQTAIVNLGLAMPELAAEARNRLVDEVFRHLARSLALFAHFPRLTRDNVGRWIRYEGFEHFEEALKRGRGVLFFTAHLGNWELSAFAHALLAAPMHVVVRPLDNPKLNALVARHRELCGNRLIDKKDAARAIWKALKANQAVGVLADQNAAVEEGVFVNFFGKPACAHTGPARLAARSGAAVIPGFALWSEAESRYVLRFYPPVAMTGNVQDDTQRLQETLEAVIRQHPEQWLWFHRRWKTRPAGEPPLY